VRQCERKGIKFAALPILDDVPEIDFMIIDQ